VIDGGALERGMERRWIKWFWFLVSGLVWRKREEVRGIVGEEWRN
jgi:hypothetical protein